MSPKYTSKICNRCHQEKPATTEFWHGRSISPDGLSYTCKACETERSKQRTAERGEEINRRARENRKDPVKGDKIRERDRKNAAKRDPEKRKAYHAKWYAENKTHVQAYAEKNKDKIAPYARDRVKQWAKNNPEKYKANMKKQKARKRAIIKQAEGHHTAKQILALYEEQEGLCAYCGIRLFDEYHVDHYIPLARGGSNDISNLFCVCPECNSSKRDKMPEEWIAWRNSHVTAKL